MFTLLKAKRIQNFSQREADIRHWAQAHCVQGVTPTFRLVQDIGQVRKRAVSGSNDRTLKVWDLASGDVLATLTCDAGVMSCASAGENLIVAGDSGGHLHFLRLEEPKAPIGSWP